MTHLPLSTGGEYKQDSHLRRPRPRHRGGSDALACIEIADASGGQVTYDAGVIGIRAPDKHGLVLRTAQLHGWHGAAVISYPRWVMPLIRPY
ncbi:MAG: hypothetical protein WAV12_08405, partial [Trebonia sp.]